jgi:hypothetical protein
MPIKTVTYEIKFKNDECGECEALHQESGTDCEYSWYCRAYDEFLFEFSNPCISPVALRCYKCEKEFPV